MNNRAIPPTLTRATAGVEPYTGPWDAVHAEHLLRRTTFGYTRDDVAYVAGLTPAAAVAMLLSAQADPPEPYGYGLSDPANPSSPKRIYAWSEYTSTLDSYYRTGLSAWWIGLMLKSNRSLREKMTLFWHNHFVSESLTVSSLKYMYLQNQLFRQSAFGNFKTLVRNVTTDPAMLVYLNGNANTKSSPNENYARELQELFTIGKGPEIAAGNYTNYTEQDVKAAARVLTGWRDNRTTWTSYFDSTRHDTTDKTFSSAYQGTVIAGKTGTAGADELDALLTMIFNQSETARYICRKLYRWFVYYDITPAVEQNVIEPLAAQLRSSGYEIKPVLETLLLSAHFHADDSIGALIKNPVDFVMQAYTHFRIAVPEPGTTEATQLASLNARYALFTAIGQQQLVLFDPPNVAGWPAYYQSPQFHELWINTVTLPLRGGMSDKLVTSKTGLFIDAIAYVKDLLADASDPKKLVDAIAKDLFPIDITQNQSDFLRSNVLLSGGLPDYEWTVEWNDYLANPTNTTKKEAVNGKLKTLLQFMLRMAEYHLS